MPNDRPSARLLHALTRKQLDQILDLLETLDAAANMPIGEPFEVINDNGTFRLRLFITRLAVQQCLPGVVAMTAQVEVQAVKEKRPLKMTLMHEKILSNATTTPERAEDIIARCKPYTFNSGTRNAVYDMVRAGLLVRHLGNRYSLPGDREPVKPASPSDSRTA